MKKQNRPQILKRLKDAAIPVSITAQRPGLTVTKLSLSTDLVDVVETPGKGGKVELKPSAEDEKTEASDEVIKEDPPRKPFPKDVTSYGPDQKAGAVKPQSGWQRKDRDDQDDSDVIPTDPAPKSPGK